MMNTTVFVDEHDAPANPALQRLDPRYRTQLRMIIGGFGLVPLGALAFGDRIALEVLPASWPYGVVTGIAVFLYLAAVLILPGRRHRHWSYAMGEDALRTAHGFLVRKETVVPFARVQHLDIARGPVERSLGLATLILHTAGSYNSTVKLPGLPTDRAIAMREAIRAHIRQDMP